MNPFKQLRLAILLVFLLIVLGGIGFHYTENMPPLEAVFAAVSTLTTMGLGKQPETKAGMIFTMVLAISGVFIIFTVVFGAIGNALEAATSDKMQYLIWRRKMDKSIRSMRDHYIICGYGRMGQAIAGEFRARKVPFLVIENNENQVPKLIEEKTFFVDGDASDEKVLRTAGVERAKGLISVAPSDADNTFIVLSAKGVNPNLFVVARSIKVEDEPKLRRAGADKVISPYILGGKRMAWALLRPNVIDFLDSAIYSESIELEIEEIQVSSDSKFANKAIGDSGLRFISGATVIAIKSPTGELTSSPSPEVQIRDGDILIAVGTQSQLSALQEMVQS